MSQFTVSSYVRSDSNDRPINILSIFLHPVPFSAELLDEAVAGLLSSSGPFDRVHVYGVPQAVTIARDIFRSESTVRSRFQKVLQSLEQQVTFITWTHTNQPTFLVETLQGLAPAETNVASLEQRFSLGDAFVKNGGLVTSVRGTHFTKPSGIHSLQFLRAANVLEKSNVSHQLVFWLYPLLCTRTVSRLIVDTSGIAPVAYALAYERLHRGVSAALPMIESHASYGGLDTLTVSDPEHTIFLISASTSGSLATKLIEKGAKPENIFTLFFLGISTPGTVICQLSEDPVIHFSGIPKIGNYLANKCPDCIKHSYPIPIVGDQFRTEPSKVEEITVALADFDETARAILDRLVSTDLFKVFRSVGSRDFELYLDVESMLDAASNPSKEQEPVQDVRLRLERLLRRGLPVHLRRIVPTAYPGTIAIARRAYEALPAEVQANVNTVFSKDLLASTPELETATLVVSGCMDDTYELMGISRDLRTVQPGGSITYVSPIFRASTDVDRRRVESNLTFGDQGPKTFTLLSVISVDLPPCITNHSWLLEYGRLLEVQYWCDINGETTPESIDDRIELLRTAPGVGLTNNLYWPAPSGAPLRLAADFTMIPTRDGRRVIPQADVFAIVTTLFHKYRQGVPKKPKLVYKTYERTVISPESFQRFSDGVLQAAFLRAARAGEIAYGNCDEKVSERMFEFLLGEVEASRQGGGHALMEYIISLLIGRLTLHPAHTNAFLESVIEKCPMVHATLIARFLASEQEEGAVDSQTEVKAVQV